MDQNLTKEPFCPLISDNDQTRQVQIDKLISDSKIFTNAIINEDFETLVDLFKSGFSVNNPFTENCVRLAASLNGNIKIIELLLEHNADINNDAYLHSALCEAIERGDAQLVDFLISHGADVHDTNSDGLNFLHTILDETRGKLKVLCRKYCVFRSEKSNTETGNSLYLYEKYVPEKDFSKVGNTYYYYSCAISQIEIEYNCYRILESLLEKDSSSINSTSDLCNTLLCTVIETLHGPFVIMLVKLLLKFGADVNLAKENQKTPLLLAIKYCKENLVPLLLEHGARIDTPMTDNCKMNALHYTIKMNRCSMFKQLLEHTYFDVNSKAFNYYALPLVHYAVKKSRPRILRALIDAGGDIFLKNEEGKRPFDIFRNTKMKVTPSGRKCFELLFSHLYLLEKLGKSYYTIIEKSLYFSYDFHIVNHMYRLSSINMNEKISKHLPVSYLKFLTASDAELAKFIQIRRNRNQILKIREDVKFACCSDLFRSCLARGQTRINLLAKKTNFDKICQFFSFPNENIVLNVYCVERILHFLNNRCLKSLIVASGGSYLPNRSDSVKILI